MDSSDSGSTFGIGRGKHYASGFTAAFTNILMTYPMQKTLFRQQLYGFSASAAVNQIAKEGVRNLYRGILPPLLQKTTSVAFMFGMYEDFSHILLRHSKGTGLSEQTVRTSAAALTGTFGISLMPFQRVQTLLQDPKHYGRFQNTPHTFYSLLRNYGVKEFYRGLVPTLMRNMSRNVLFLGLRGPIKQQLPEAQTRTGQMLYDFAVGGVLGAALSTVLYPFNVLKTRAQSVVGGRFLPIPRLLSAVVAERGGRWMSLFRGGPLNFFRSMISWGIVNCVYEYLIRR